MAAAGGPAPCRSASPAIIAAATATFSERRPGRIGTTIVVNLPGSRGGVKDAIAVLQHVLVHAAEQVVGSDH